MQGLHNLKEDFLYRALRTDEDPYRNIECKDRRSNRTVDEHVKDGLKFPSMYISTTASFYLAQKWINTSQHFCSQYNRSTTIVKIDVKHLKSRYMYDSLVRSAYNFTEEAVRDAFLTGYSKSYAETYQEVVFEGLIPVSAICDIYVEGKGWIGTEPTPISISTLPSNPIPSIPTLPSIFASISNPLLTSIHPLVSPSISPILDTTSLFPNMEPNIDTSSQVTTTSAISFFDQSDISSSSALGLDTSADTIDVITVEINTSVKRSCEVDPEVELAKYVCVDKENIQVSV